MSDLVGRPADTAGLRSVRASLTPATRFVRGPDHLVLQTPTRSDFQEGNALHVGADVHADDVDRWIGAFTERFGHLAGVTHMLVRWETGTELADPAGYHEAFVRAVGERDLGVERLTLMELTGEPRPMVPLTDGIEVVRAVRDEHWFGVRALHVSDGGHAGFETWRTDQLRAHAAAGRGAAWVAYRWGIPVATGSVWHDDAGIASVDDVVTHAVHRRLGIASHLVAVACGAHREARPDDRILLLTDHGSDAERLYGRLGFAPTGTVWSLRGPAPGA